MYFKNMKNRFYVFSVLSLLAFACAEKKETEQKVEGFTLIETMEKTTTHAPAKMIALKNQLNFYGKITADNNIPKCLAAGQPSVPPEFLGRVMELADIKQKLEALQVNLIDSPQKLLAEVSLKFLGRQ